MRQPIVPAHATLILDACCVMNLYATRQMPAILRALQPSVAVAAYVATVEALAVVDYDSAATRTRVPIQLQPLIDQGLLFIAEPDTSAEQVLFVRLSAVLDDGEAQTLALAALRNWGLATDDRRALRLIAAQFGQVTTVTTPDLLYHWHTTADPGAAVLAQALNDIQTRARFRPATGHPLFAWWQRWL